MREHYAAMHERLEYLRAAGELTSVAEVKDADRFAGHLTHTALENSVVKIGYAIAEEFKVDSVKATSTVRTEITVAMTEVARQVGGRMSAYSATAFKRPTAV